MPNQPKIEFSQALLQWFDEYGRHDLPWQKDINPYRVWVSEIMLQQTQVKTVIPYYLKFMQSFPTIGALANASQDDVLSHWAGLGYYARGRNLHKAAQQIVEEHQSTFPDSFEDIVALPGIGKSTAGAILSISLYQRFAILDGNVKRVLSRYFAIEGWPGQKTIETQLWRLAEELTPQTRFNDYTQAIMDLGATLCTRSKPMCTECPVNQGCKAYANNNVTQFPTKKPKKDKPIKQAWLLILENDKDEIFLEKRPQKGIWGGLWSVPEFETIQLCQETVQSQGSSVDSLIEWDTFRHTFSHYHLEIHPVYKRDKPGRNTNGPLANNVAEGRADYSQTQRATDTAQWVSLEQLLQGKIGLPAPVLTMVEELENRKHNRLL